MLTGRRLGLLCAAVVASAAGVGVHGTGLLNGAEERTIDARFQVRPAHVPTSVAVVGIDSDSFSELRHAWPFPRSWHAQVIDNLRKAGARTIVYDVQFTEPTKPAEDLALYRAIGRASNIVLATTEVDDHGHSNVLGGDENLARVGARAGAANLDATAGGTLRRLPYAISGLRTLAVVGAEEASGEAVAPGSFPDKGALIDFRGPPGTVPMIPFAAVKEGKFARSAVAGKVVVVGATAPTLQDVHATPVAPHQLMSGPEVQADAIWTVLNDVPLRDAPWLLGLAAVLLLGLAVPAAGLTGRSVLAALASVPLAAAYAGLSYLAFVNGLVVPVVAPLVALAVGAVSTVAAGAWMDRRERRRVSVVNTELERLVRNATEELRETQLEVVHRLGAAAEWRDEETGEHIARMSGLCRRVALALGWDLDAADELHHAAAMHDVGKIGIPDDVLRKPGRFTPEERSVMETHAAIGADILAGSNSSLLQMAEAIARTHHERWDGSGYPAGLAGEQIPLVGRIAAICDVFDALISARPYKPAWRLHDAIAELGEQRGRHFDPAIVDAFITLVPELEAELALSSDPPEAGEGLSGVLPLDASSAV